MADVRVEGADNFGRLARELRRTKDKELRKALYAGINRSVKPLTAAVKEAIPEFLPRRYAIELGKSLRVRARTRAGRNPSIYLVGKAKTKRGKERDLASLNRGRLRHPLYGDRRHWFNQPVPPNWWDDPLLQDAEMVRDQIEAVIEDVGRQFLRKL